jgi:hypothetical protein
VLLFSVDEESKSVTLEDYDHHDNIYKHWDIRPINAAYAFLILFYIWSDMHVLF